MTILREGLRDKEEGCANSQSQPSFDVDHHKDSELPTQRAFIMSTITCCDMLPRRTLSYRLDH